MTSTTYLTTRNSYTTTFLGEQKTIDKKHWSISNHDELMKFAVKYLNIEMIRAIYEDLALNGRLNDFYNLCIFNINSVSATDKPIKKSIFMALINNMALVPGFLSTKTG